MNKNSGGSIIAIFIALGLALMIGPFALKISGGAGYPIAILGLVVFSLGVMLFVFTRLYKRASADMAFVVTGGREKEAIMDGGKVVIPFKHGTIDVPLQTMKIRTEAQGLLTKDKQRVDIHAEFFFRVQPEKSAIIAAASTLGEKLTSTNAVNEFLKEKFASALRTVAGTMDLEDLQSKRADFVETVQKTLAPELIHNGLILEPPSLSKLDQAPINEESAMTNVFDAEGLRIATKKIRENLVQKNQIEASAAQEIETQNVEKTKIINAQKVMQAEVDADMKIKIATQQASANRAAELVVVEKDLAVKQAQVAAEQSIAVLDEQKQQATNVAVIAREKATELANREKAITVAEAEQRKAAAEGKRIEAEAARELETQKLTTIQVEQEAERQKNRTVIEAKGVAEKKKLEEQVTVDVEAYKLTTQAAAQQKAAALTAEARTTTAKAEKDAQLLEAEGKLASEMIPVNVAQKKVDVDAAQVLVDEKRLKIQAENAAVSIELQIKLAQIEATKIIGIEQAKAAGLAMSSAEIRVFGTSDQMTSMMDSIMKGQNFGELIGGAVSALPEDAVENLTSLLTGLKGLMSGSKVVDNGGTKQPGATVR